MGGIDGFNVVVDRCGGDVVRYVSVVGIGVRWCGVYVGIGGEDIGNVVNLVYLCGGGVDGVEIGDDIEC